MIKEIIRQLFIAWLKSRLPRLQTKVDKIQYKLDKMVNEVDEHEQIY